MKKWVYLGLAALLFLSFGCAPRYSGPFVPKPPATGQYDLSPVETSGNYSYIPLNIKGDVSDHTAEILGALATFETVHPELEITFWQIDKQQFSYATSSFIFGIWVSHKPKK